MARTIIALVALLSLSACAATTQDVVSVGNGNYELAGTGRTAYSSGGTEKVKLLRVANTYCAKQNKQATLVQADTTDAHARPSLLPGGILTRAGVLGGDHATADVVFQCQ